MDLLSAIKAPIAPQLQLFEERFEQALTHTDALLSQALGYIARRSGKRMRPILILLTAQCYGRISDVTLHAAVGVEMLHTASLVHDDVVDESGERRAQPSVNAMYGNKVAVLVGDYLLSTALLNVAHTRHGEIIEYLARLGQTLASGEILQLSNTQQESLSEAMYYDIIERKTAALFEACCAMGAMSVGADERQTAEARAFGRYIGMIFQIRDDIFDYYDSGDIGKPTGNDMAEGKLTLPALYVVNGSSDSSVRAAARAVKSGTATERQIAFLVERAKNDGGIDYAYSRMDHYRRRAQQYIDSCGDTDAVRRALQAYLDYMIERRK